ncbi:MAG: translocation/assembly module TamB domain-containing protein [Firmicutes bacterium]|nr:translocation/assembly module TamB domain-containing protein [Bacillota bacterium]MCM1401763.1 translocation/assembly module TamB domain-containing protein [Bacteroides sp.]MCM1478011.1 translocation/assembly module TamB domain-containing protein [Bacteroides sp.]
MKQYVKWPYKILRTCLILVVVLLFLIPSSLYVALSLPSVQREIATRAEKELSQLLTVDVSIGSLSITPFNRLTLNDVTIADSLGQPAVYVNRLGAGISLMDYLRRRDIIITYVELTGLNAKITKATPDSPLNIQPIINALKPKDKTKPPTRFDLRLNTVVIRNSAVSYDLLSVPADSSRFNPNHIRISNLRADIVAPRIKNDDFTVELRRLSLREHCGLKLTNLTGSFHVTAKGSQVKDLVVDLASTHLAFGDINVEYDGFDDLKHLWVERPVEIDLLKGSYIGASDAVPFVPQLAGLNLTLNTELKAQATRESVRVDRLDLNSSYGFSISMSGNITEPFNKEKAIVDIPDLVVNADAHKVLDLVNRFTSLPSNAATIIGNMGLVNLEADLKGSYSEGSIIADLAAAPGTIKVDTRFKLGARPNFAGKLNLDGFSGACIMQGINGPLADLGNLTAGFDYDISVENNKRVQGKLAADIADIVYRQHHFTDISARFEASGNTYTGSLDVENPGVLLDLDASATVEGPEKKIYVNLAARDVEPSLFNIDPLHPDRRFSVYLIGELSGPDVDHVNGQIDIDDLTYGAPGSAIHLQDLDFDLSNVNGFSQVRMSSDVMDGLVEGTYRLSKLPVLVRSMVSNLLPALTGGTSNKKIALENSTDSLYYTFIVKDTSPIEPMVKLPVKIHDKVRIDGSLNAASNSFDFRLDAPYIQQGNKLFENTSLTAAITALDGDSISSRGNVEFSTMLDTKNGPLTLLATANAAMNQVDTRVQWKVARDRDYSGNLSLSALFNRDDDNKLQTRLDVNPGRVVFNDTVWTVEPSYINIEGKRAEVHNFRVGRDNQFITIEGVASPNPADSIVLTLEDVNLDYVFETLNIPTAMFGGNATGVFYATDLFSSHPKAYTPALKVKNLTYNHSLMGNALIKSAWEPVAKAVTLDADVAQPNGRHSFIKGQIKPMADSLDLSFDADKISIGFLLPFMSAFATDISGYASGKARLYGSFKLIDMVGDVYGEDVKLTLGFTNTSYSTTDSVHFRPGRIDIPDVTIKDIYGHTAKLSGWVTHECFKSPRFDFQVRDASNLLVYDVKENPETRWFGHVFGNGTATIKGEPGIVDISANITTGPSSVFTFVLSDALDAQDYKFITFRDRDQALKDSIAAASAPPQFVQELKARLANHNVDGPPSVYKINLTANVTPQCEVILVMDPVGGDKIRAYGSGTMNMIYDSANESLNLTGSYTVDRGKYNFTLQDIIIKEFNLKSGSIIKFSGDPYAAELDIAATYSVNANLSDLDESFLTDKDLNRTNVPVNALLLVHGDMRMPEIKFDLEFPTLTKDVYDKVKSIVNTEDMMNRQIIYLLALSRFYTPEYMSATKGNELVSVASSTFSSQLSSMLGQLSDKWSVAPNIRSDRGDFSDVEVDLALSSHLLNNRLLLNGNFGYRDNALNNNSFIGDFDIEYLLNRRGTIRLKAYNRYNDQNYYVKTALTTQGVGVMFKRDFDNMFSFLRPLLHRKHKSDSTATSPDSIPLDSVKTQNIKQ